MRILVATDFSTRSQRAVRRAGILAQQTGADVMLMHVVNGAGSRQVARDVREAQRMTVEQAAVVPELFRVDCRSLVVPGRLPDPVLNAAAARQVDLIVVGSDHGKDAQGLGQTVRDLIRAAPCPILVVNRSVVGPYAEVTVPVDLSAASARALHGVASLGLADRARVTVVHAFDVLGKPRLSGFGIPREQIEGYVESWRSVYAEETEAFLEAEGLARRNWVRRTEEGRPDEVIASLAARTCSELLVMGTRGRTGFRRALLGSVTEAVLAAGQADVLVVPPPRPGSSSRSERSGWPLSAKAERTALQVVTA